MKVYIACRFSRRDEAEYVVRPALEALGWTVTSRWHREQANQPVDGAMAHHSAEENKLFALRDLEDVDAADALLLLTEEPESYWPRGARHTEYGYALAKGKALFLVGPREQVFHWMLPDSAVFASIQDLVNCFEGED
jgi:nucleoside 2-deoxyribosyltransferase